MQAIGNLGMYPGCPLMITHTHLVRTGGHKHKLLASRTFNRNLDGGGRKREKYNLVKIG